MQPKYLVAECFDRNIIHHRKSSNKNCEW